MEGSIIVPPELPHLSPKVIIQAFQLVVYRQVGLLTHEFDPNTDYIYFNYPPPDISGPLYNSSAFIPLPPEKFPAPSYCSLLEVQRRIQCQQDSTFAYVLEDEGPVLPAGLYNFLVGILHPSFYSNVFFWALVSQRRPPWCHPPRGHGCNDPVERDSLFEFDLFQWIVLYAVE